MRRRKCKGQASIEFAAVLIIIFFLVYGLIRIFRWAGLDLAERRWAAEMRGSSMEQQLAPNFYRPKRLHTVFESGN